MNDILMWQFTSFAKRSDFAEIVQQSLSDILAESSARTILYYPCGATVIQYPELFVQRLRHIFDISADVIVRRIINNPRKKKAAQLYSSARYRGPN
ncbi:MAG: hypothetical protein M1503_08025 [Thaumarchaeota archaeon]|nr:hypothetical protein [Nitrososphaerota archaeon]MCL5318187.1 hypothetical protein [Nitrososphaerota archaeon]